MHFSLLHSCIAYFKVCFEVSKIRLPFFILIPSYYLVLAYLMIVDLLGMYEDFNIAIGSICNL